MPALVYRYINFKCLIDTENDYNKNKTEDEEIIDFQKIRNQINVLHRMYIKDYDKAVKYMLKSKKYNCSEISVILGCVQEIVEPFYLHNCTKNEIKELEKDFINVKNKLTYD